MLDREGNWDSVTKTRRERNLMGDAMLDGTVGW